MEKKNMSTLFGKVCMILLLIALFSVNAYAQAAKSESKPIELKYASISHQHTSTMKDVGIPWAKELEKATNGRVKIVFYFSHSMGKTKDHYDFAVQGISDISFTLPAFTPGRFPLTTVMELPLINPNGAIGTKVLWDLYQRFPEMRAEHDKVKVLWMAVSAPSQLHTVKKLVKTVDDFQGMTLGTSGRLPMKTIAKMGGAPQRIPSQEAYQALQRGVVDGFMASFLSIEGNKLYEVAKYHTILNSWSFSFVNVMNRKTWESLPADVQKILDDVSRHTWLRAGEGLDYGDNRSLEIIKKAPGQEFYVMPEAEVQKARTLVKPIWDEYAADLEAKGLPGRKIVDEAFKLVEKYQREK